MNVLVEKNVSMALRDGTTLRADLYRPAGDERHPVLVQRTPYNKEFAPITNLTFDPVRGAAAGYAVLIQDVRARWASEGGPFFPYRNEADDGHDTVAWAVDQPWCDGRAGAYGISYTGGAAWLAASTGPPGLGAIAAATAPDDAWPHWYPGGALALGLLTYWSLVAVGPSALLRARRGSPDLVPDLLRLVDDIDAYDRWVRHLPLGDFPPARPEDPSLLPFFFELLRHPTPDDFTRSMLMAGRHRSVGVPALILAGWHDLLLGDDLAHFRHMRDEAASDEARRGTRLIVGPWSHGMFQNVVGDLNFGFRSSGVFLDLREDLTNLQLRWFDRWVKGIRNGVDEEAPVKLFVMGRNRWRDEQDWPLARARPTRWFLHADGAFGPHAPPADGATRSYVYDPQDPCPTRGGRLLMPATYRAGPLDQGPLLGRRDVLVYTSDPLPDDVEVTGPVTAVLHAATSGPDTDWVVKLCDVHPDGRTFNVCDGILRARYRRSATDPTLLDPHTVECYEMDLGATAMVFLAGHRLRVLVTSSDFPRYDRNLNTGALGADSAETRPALQTVCHDGQRASHLVLPLLR